MASGEKRRAARVICFDPDERILLVKWRDPVSGRTFWEPPGGGVEKGESDREAAARELIEETGISVTLYDEWSMEVPRDVWWAGRHLVGRERFFGAKAPRDCVACPTALTETEVGALLDTGWFSREDLTSMSHELEPPELPEVARRLAAADARHSSP